MSSEIALLGRGPQGWGRARSARGQGLRWTRVGVLLLACACGESEGSRSTPLLPSEPPDAGPVAAASPPPDSASPGPDAGTGEPSSGEPPSGEPSGFSPAIPDDFGPAAPSIDYEAACSDLQSRVICKDTENIVLCVSGAPIESRCSTLCDSYGRNTGPCDDGCQCGEPTNPTCDRASEDFCACAALTGAEPCTPETSDRLYLACHVNGFGGELMTCTADFRATRPDAAIDAAFCADLDDACD